MTDRLALPRRYRDQLEALLREHVPGVEVWAYGSRVNGKSHEGSDLDLALRGPALKPLDGGLYDLLEAIEKSNIPFLVQVHDWAMLPESFHREIERDYVVLQKGAKKRSTVAADRWRETDYGTFRHDFQVDSLCNLCSNEGGIQTGPFGSQLHQEDYVPVGTPIITVEHLGENRIIHRDLPRVSDYDRNRLSRYTIRQGDIVFSRVGSVDRRSLVREAEEGWLFSGRCLRVRPDVNKIDPAYLSYFFGLPAFQEHIRSIAVGATMPSLNTQILSSASIVYPPLPEQRAIAHVLGTLDDKIELNRRMNETLEAMARTLFKSWFVDFDPVRAKMDGRWHRGESLPGLLADLYDLFPDRLVDSEQGEIPEGWEVKPLGAFGEIITGKTPSTKRTEYYGEDVPFLRIPDMHGKMYALKTELMLSAQGAESQSKKTLPPGSVSVSCIATPGLVVLNHRDTQTNQQINGIVPYDQSVSRYLYWTCCHLSSDIATGGLGGSVFGNMNKSTFSALLAIHPEPTIIRAFDALVSPIHTAILGNEEQAHTLAAQRDALLPRLVSGEVQVGKLNASVG